MYWYLMAELRFNQKSPIITVFAKIEGEKTRRVRVVLDTGATYVMISWKITEILGYIPEASLKKTNNNSRWNTACPLWSEIYECFGNESV